MTPLANAAVLPINEYNTTPPTSNRKHKETKIPDGIRCLIDVADIDGKFFSAVRANGKTSNKGAPLRKLVLMVIARYAKPDGSCAWMSRKTLLKRLPCSDRQLQNTIDWLKNAGMAEVGYKKHQSGTNIYKVLIPEISEDLATIDAMSVGSRPSNFEDGLSNLENAHSNNDCRTPSNNDCKQTSVTFLQNVLYNVPAQSPQVSKQNFLKSTDQKHRQVRNFQDEANIVANELAYVSNNEVIFNNKERSALAKQLKSSTFDEIVRAFKEYLANIDGDDFKKRNASRLFVEGMDQLIYTARRKATERAFQDAAVASKAAELQAEAEQDRVERAKARKRELELVEEELPD